MTELPEGVGATEHPDEGLIHAWLDGALSAPEAERLEAHVRSCAECQARVAEARGLIAGASRIVAALDDAPAGARPGWAQGAVAAGAPAASEGAASAPVRGSLWRWLHVTPTRAAVAATILVALGLTLTHREAAKESARTATAVLNPQRTDVPGETPAEGGAPMAAAPARDRLLDSAVARSVAQSQGRRSVEAAPGPALPQPPATSAPLAAAEDAGERVALGRAMAQAQRETAGVAADRARVGKAQGYSAAAGMAAAAAPPARAEADARRPDVAVMSRKEDDTGARSCVRIESTDPDAHWADQPFPLIIALDPPSAAGRRTGAVLTPTGSTTELRATWAQRGNDSVSITLRRIGYSGSIVLGPESGGRSGYAVSSAAPATSTLAVAEPAPQTRARAADEPAAPAARKAAAPAPQPAPSAAPGPPVRQLRVTARTVGCP